MPLVSVNFAPVSDLSRSVSGRTAAIAALMKCPRSACVELVAQRLRAWICCLLGRVSVGRARLVVHQPQVSRRQRPSLRAPMPVPPVSAAAASLHFGMVSPHRVINAGLRPFVQEPNRSLKRTLACVVVHRSSLRPKALALLGLVVAGSMLRGQGCSMFLSVARCLLLCRPRRAGWFPPSIRSRTAGRRSAHVRRGWRHRCSRIVVQLT